MSWQKDLYWRLPAPVQNLAVSMAGLRRRRQRLGGRFRPFLAELLARQWWTTERLADYQITRLRQLVAEAMKHVPYYRETFTRHGIDPQELTDIKQLPFLDKEAYRLHQDRLVSERWPRKQLLEFHTSGSTGTPLTWFVELDDFRERMAILARQFEWAGVRVGDRIATLTGNLIVGRHQDRPPFWRHNWPGNQLMLSSYHLTEKNLPAYVDAMGRFNPVVIEGYPSAIYVLAQWIQQHQQSGRLRPSAVLVTAETLHEFQRETIEEVFGVHVRNYYGSSEGAPMISECSEGGLHINMDSGIFELLRPDGTDAAPGEMAEMVVTTLASRAMPLIRYRIGDLAIPAEPGPCRCGRHMPRVREIVGRLDDMIYTRDRGWVGRLSQVMKVFPGSIREAQIVQESVDQIVVRLVRDPARFAEDQIPAMLSDLRNRVGEVVKISVEYADEIPKGANSKLKYVVCKLSREQKQQLWGHRTENEASRA